MTPARKKWLHAFLVGAVGALTDFSAQLIAHTATDLPRTVAVGLVVGVVARLIGAALAAWASSDSTNRPPDGQE